MTRVRVAELKANLSRHLRDVRRGRVLAVYDRTTPVAVVSPYRAEGEVLEVRRPAEGAPRLARIRMPPPLPASGDVVELLLSDRASGR